MLTHLQNFLYLLGVSASLSPPASLSLSPSVLPSSSVSLYVSGLGCVRFGPAPAPSPLCLSLGLCPSLSLSPLVSLTLPAAPASSRNSVCQSVCVSVPSSLLQPPPPASHEVCEKPGPASGNAVFPGTPSSAECRVQKEGGEELGGWKWKWGGRLRLRGPR